MGVISSFIPPRRLVCLQSSTGLTLDGILIIGNTARQIIHVRMKRTGGDGSSRF